MKKVGVFGVPRSGTTWIAEIINSSPNVIYKYQPLFSYAHKDYLNEQSGAEDIEAFFERLKLCDDDFTNQTEKRESGAMPTFEKYGCTHVVFKEVRYINIVHALLSKCKDIKIVAIIRNPFSVIDSWLNAPREFRADLGWEVEEEWRWAPKKNQNKPEEFNGYEKWKEAIDVFETAKLEFPDRVLIVNYDEFRVDPECCAKQLFEYLELDFGQQTRKFLFDSTSNQNDDHYAVYRSKNMLKPLSKLPEHIVNEIRDDLASSGLQAYDCSGELFKLNVGART